MSFKVNKEEQGSLEGLPHLQRVLYYEGIRPYMDFATGIVGVKRKISYQSLSEELYTDPHPGYKSGSPSKAQIKRALLGLQKAGLITKIPSNKNLIFKCNMAEQGKFVENKVVTKPSPQAVTVNLEKSPDLKPFSWESCDEAVPPKSDQAVTPPVSGNNKIKISENFTPSEFLIAKANSHDCEDPREQSVLLKFIAYHQSRGTTSVDWQAEYFRWLLIGKEFKQKEKMYGSKNIGKFKQNLYGKKSGAIERVIQANRDVLEQSHGRIIEG